MQTAPAMTDEPPPAEQPTAARFSADDALDSIIAELEAAIRAPTPTEPSSRVVATSAQDSSLKIDTPPQDLTTEPALAALARLNQILAVLDPPRMAADPVLDDDLAEEPQATDEAAPDAALPDAAPIEAESAKADVLASVAVPAGPIAVKPAKPAASQGPELARLAKPIAATTSLTGQSLTRAIPARLASAKPSDVSPALNPDLHPIMTLPGPTRATAAMIRPDRRAERVRQAVILTAALLPALAIGAAAFWGSVTPPPVAPAATLAAVPLDTTPVAPVVAPPPVIAVIPPMQVQPVALTAAGAVVGSHRAAQDLPDPSAALSTMAGLLPDDVKALEISAKAGNPMAQHDLAARYAAGRGVAQDYGAAIRWFSAAARQGVANAAYNLGVLYQQGLGVSPDAAQAIAWYRQAAEAGHAEAQYNLGVALIEGQGVPPDPKAAVQWLTKAEANGVAQAAFNLGVIAELGLAGDVKTATARDWYAKAAAAGDMQAAAAIARLRNHQPGEPSEDFARPLPGVILASTVPLPPRKPVEAEMTAPRKPVDAETTAPSQPAKADIQPRAAITPPIKDDLSAKDDLKDDTPGGFIPPDNHDLRPPREASADDVQAAQQLLSKLGYNPGPIDGRRGSQLMEAIIAFERKSGLPVDGEVSDRLLEKLIQTDTAGQ